MDEAVATRQRAELVGRLQRKGVLRTERIARALNAVPRHRFVPARERDSAYRDIAVFSKWDDRGRAISSVSQPSMVATMLEQLEVEPGHRVLEIGTGSGYNAALLAALVGAHGEVVSIEIDDGLAEAARATLAATGMRSVTVLVGDGARGDPNGAPFDRIIVTAGAREVAPAWPEQLGRGGRLVVPLVDKRGAGVSVAFEQTSTGLTRRSESPCAFLPLRGNPGP